MILEDKVHNRTPVRYRGFSLNVKLLIPKGPSAYEKNYNRVLLGRVFWNQYTNESYRSWIFYSIHTIRFTDAITNILFYNFKLKIQKFILNFITNKILLYWGKICWSEFEMQHSWYGNSLNVFCCINLWPQFCKAILEQQGKCMVEWLSSDKLDSLRVHIIFCI
jgi:hypothetical protein